MLSADANPATGEVVVAAVGELQLEIVVDRLKREFHVEAGVGRPLVAYRETVTRQADGEGRLARQTEGHGEYAHVKVHLYPGAPGSGYVFANEIRGDAIPPEFIKPVDDGIREALARGVLAGYPVEDVRLVLYDGACHNGESSEFAFRVAGSMAFDDAARKARAVLIEPVMRVEVMTPTECVGDVFGDLSRRRGQIESHDDCDGVRRVVAQVPLSEMFGYAADLRSRTRGRATFVMQFARYQPCDPPDHQENGGDSLVGVPRQPSPTGRDSTTALPEPTDDPLRE